MPRGRTEIGVPLYDMKEHEAGANSLFTHEELIKDAPLRAYETYQHIPPVPPYGQIIQDRSTPPRSKDR